MAEKINVGVDSLEGAIEESAVDVEDDGVVRSKELGEREAPNSSSRPHAESHWSRVDAYELC
jgi:hypothetical protein